MAVGVHLMRSQWRPCKLSKADWLADGRVGPLPNDDLRKIVHDGSLHRYNVHDEYRLPVIDAKPRDLVCADYERGQVHADRAAIEIEISRAANGSSSPARNGGGGDSDSLSEFDKSELTCLIDVLSALGDREWDPPLTTEQKSCVAKLGSVLFKARLAK